MYVLCLQLRISFIFYAPCTLFYVFFLNHHVLMSYLLYLLRFVAFFLIVAVCRKSAIIDSRREELKAILYCTYIYAEFDLEVLYV